MYPPDPWQEVSQEGKNCLVMKYVSTVQYVDCSVRNCLATVYSTLVGFIGDIFNCEFFVVDDLKTLTYKV